MRKRWRSRARSGIEELGNEPSSRPVQLDEEESLHEEFGIHAQSDEMQAGMEGGPNAMELLFGD